MIGHGFLGSIDEPARTRLREAMHVRCFDRDTLVVSHEDASDRVYFVLSGRARATIFSPDGKKVSFRDIGPGGMFGELSAIDHGKRSASVTALDTLTTGTLSGSSFREMTEKEPALMWALLRHLTGQVRDMTERIFEFSTLLVKDRLINELVRLSKKNAGANNAAVLRPAPTHFDLAAALSTHREAVSREMSTLSKLGLVAKRGDELHILDIKKLKALAVKSDC